MINVRKLNKTENEERNERGVLVMVTDCHDIAEILLKVALSTIILTLIP